MGQQTALDCDGNRLCPPATLWPLLGNLLCAPGFILSRQALAGALWPDFEERLARHSLATALWRIRKRIEGIGAWLSVGKNTVGLLPEFARTIDVAQFETEASARLQAPATLDACEARERLRAALDLYAGDFLPQVAELSIQIERERLRALFLDAGLEYVRACCRHGEWRPACEIARTICAVEPFREDAQRLLMEALAGCGNEASALLAYRAFERLLAEELSVSPAPETRAIAERIERRLHGPGAAPAIARLPVSPAPRSLLIEVRRQFHDGLHLLDQVLTQGFPEDQPRA